MHQGSAQAMPLMETAVGRRFRDVAEKVPPMLTLLALRACRFSQACVKWPHVKAVTPCSNRDMPLQEQALRLQR